MSQHHHAKRQNLRALRRRHRFLEGIIPKATQEGNTSLPFYQEEAKALAWALEMLDRDYGPANATQIIDVLGRARTGGRWDGVSTVAAREILAAESIAWDEFARGVVTALTTLERARRRQEVAA